MKTRMATENEKRLVAKIAAMSVTEKELDYILRRKKSRTSLAVRMMLK